MFNTDSTDFNYASQFSVSAKFLLMYGMQLSVFSDALLQVKLVASLLWSTRLEVEGVGKTAIDINHVERGWCVNLFFQST
jgi:hypothetical protein